MRYSINLRRWKKELFGCLVKNLVNSCSEIFDIVDFITPFLLRQSPRDTETLVTMAKTSQHTPDMAIIMKHLLCIFCMLPWGSKQYSFLHGVTFHEPDAF